MKQELIKPLALYLILSVIAILFANRIYNFLVYYHNLLADLDTALYPVFSSSYSGTMLRRTLVLLLLPVIISGVPALLYRLVRKKNLPYFHVITWILWLTLLFAMIFVY